jgi:zinc protease
METLKQSGGIVAETDTRSEASVEALRLMVEEFWNLQRERVGERELSDAKAYLTGSFPLSIETPDAIALQVLNAVFYGLDLAELQTYRERVNAVTVDDIQRVARQFLKPDRLSIVLVGDASRFDDDLRGLGFDRVERIALTQLDLSTADFRKGGTRAPEAGEGKGGRADGGAAARTRWQLVGRGMATPVERPLKAFAFPVEIGPVLFQNPAR